MTRVLWILIAFSVLAEAQTNIAPKKPGRSQQSRVLAPGRGSLLLSGGVGDNSEIDSEFRTLAGGSAARIVVIPTASVGDAGPPGMNDFLIRRNKQRFRVATVTVLHTLDRATSDSDRFVEALQSATGVWILGGFPPLLVRSYLGTKTERAILGLLDRGGVVGGESAGAMMQASWLDTTDDEFTPDLRALITTYHRAGFGLLTNVAVFPHFNKHGREAAEKFRLGHPDHVGIGIDEDTALIVKGGHFEIVGNGTVYLYNGGGQAANPTALRRGDKYSLATRR